MAVLAVVPPALAVPVPIAAGESSVAATPEVAGWRSSPPVSLRDSAAVVVAAAAGCGIAAASREVSGWRSSAPVSLRDSAAVVVPAEVAG